MAHRAGKPGRASQIRRQCRSMRGGRDPGVPSRPCGAIPRVERPSVGSRVGGGPPVDPTARRGEPGWRILGLPRSSHQFFKYASTLRTRACPKVMRRRDRIDRAGIAAGSGGRATCRGHPQRTEAKIRPFRGAVNPSRRVFAKSLSRNGRRSSGDFGAPAGAIWTFVAPPDGPGRPNRTCHPTAIDPRSGIARPQHPPARGGRRDVRQSSRSAQMQFGPIKRRRGNCRPECWKFLVVTRWRAEARAGPSPPSDDGRRPRAGQAPPAPWCTAVTPMAGTGRRGGALSGAWWRRSRRRCTGRRRSGGSGRRGGCGRA